VHKIVTQPKSSGGSATSRKMTPGESEGRLSCWPESRPMAAVLTHDVDYLYDREFFRILGNLNRLRGIYRPPDRQRACLHRLARSILRPKRVGEDVRRLRTLEKRYNWPSTFFLLEDRYWARYGGRYRWDDNEVRRLAAELVEEGCELGIHGSFYNFSDAGLLRRQRERFESIFGVPAGGIRNHYLRFDGVSTWKAQEQAGFGYDSTYGFRNTTGTRGGLALPFFPRDPVVGAPIDVLELPLTIMDVTVFNRLGLGAEQAAELVKNQVADLVQSGGVGVFLWHNNFFGEPEFSEYEEVYQVLLSSLQEARAWVTTAGELQDWWRDQAPFTVIRDITPREGEWCGTVIAKKNLNMLCLGFEVANNGLVVEATRTDLRAERQERQVLIQVPHLAAEDVLRLCITGVRAASSD
jgi:peptidoglycan/xylan/chitin deacetylase (PgdA/CDA1 family)